MTGVPVDGQSITARGVSFAKAVADRTNSSKTDANRLGRKIDESICGYDTRLEAKRLKSLAQEIRSLRIEFGQTKEHCERFIQICSLRGPNVPGELKLAAEFLARLTST